MSDRREGAPIPAKCTRCGLVFRSRLFNFSSTFDVTVEDCFEPCPKCGARAEVARGTYDFGPTETTLVHGPESSREQLQTLLAIIEQSRAAGEAPEQTLEKIKREAPDTFGWLTSPKALGAMAVVGGAAGIVSALVAVAQLLVSLRPASLSDEDVERIARRVVAEQRIEQPDPRIEKETAHAEPEEHGSDPAKRITNPEHRPRDRQGPYKQRPKRKG